MIVVITWAPASGTIYLSLHVGICEDLFFPSFHISFVYLPKAWNRYELTSLSQVLWLCIHPTLGKNIILNVIVISF